MRNLRLTPLLLPSLACTLIFGCPSSPALVKAAHDSLDFGEAELSTGTHRLPLWLLNAGGRTAHLSVLSIDGAEDLVLERAITTLDADEAHAVVLAWTPAQEGLLEARLIFDADDGLGPRSVALHGSAVHLAATLTADTPGTCGGQAGALDLGTVTSGDPVEQTVTLTSTGTGTITVLRALTDADAGLTVLGLDQPVSLAPGASTHFTIHDDPLLSGPQTGAVTFRTTSQLSPTLALPFCSTARVPRLCVVPEALDLGAAGAGVSLHGQVAISSCGNLPLTVTAASLDEDGGFSLAPVQLPTTLQPGDSRTLSLGLEASTTLATRSTLHLRTDSPATPALAVPVGANLPPPCSLSISPSSLAFQRVLTPSRVLRLTNRGGTDCLLERATISPASPFTIDRLPSFPAVLPARGSFELALSFHPASAESSTSNATLELELDQVHEVPLRGDAAAPAGCHLVADPPALSFGAIWGSGAGTKAFTLLNVGAGTCSIAGLSATPPFEALAATNTIAGLGSLSVEVSKTDVRLDGGVYGVSVSSNDPASPLGVPIRAGFASCEPSCACDGTQTLSFWRFSEGVSSAITSPADAGAPPFVRSCEPAQCEAGQVAVEVGRDQWQCTALPQSCAGRGFDFSRDAGWSCAPCDYVVQYGGLYDGDRFCAPKPPACGSGSAATFDVTSRRWQCKPTCDNGSYDQRLTPQGVLVCVPC